MRPYIFLGSALMAESRVHVCPAWRVGHIPAQSPTKGSTAAVRSSAGGVLAAAWRVGHVPAQTPTKGFTAAVRSSAGEVLVGHEVGDPISVILQLSGSGVYLLDLRQLIIIFRFNLNQYFFVILFVTSGIFKLVI